MFWSKRDAEPDDAVADDAEYAESHEHDGLWFPYDCTYAAAVKLRQKRVSQG